MPWGIFLPTTNRGKGTLETPAGLSGPTGKYLPRQSCSRGVSLVHDFSCRRSPIAPSLNNKPEFTEFGGVKGGGPHGIHHKEIEI